MFDVLLVSHGHLAQEALATARMVYGEPTGKVTTLGFCPGESQDELLLKIEAAVRDSAPRGCLVMCDILGGSPFLMAAKAFVELRDEVPIEVISGLSLGMLVEALSAQEDASLSDAKSQALAAAQQSIRDVSEQFS